MIFEKDLSVRIVFCLVLVTAFSGCTDSPKNSLEGDWEWVNNPNDKYPTVNTFFQGVRIYEDSLLFVSDYMFNPFFNKREYYIKNDLLFINYDDGNKSIKYSLSRDSLILDFGELVYICKRINQATVNVVDSISFSSHNPDRSPEKNYFFILDINKEGKFVYGSKYGEWVTEGVLDERYRDFIFDKANKVKTPIPFNKDEEIIQGDHTFELELFENGIRIDSILYSREIDGAYAKWLSSILQSTPLWINDAVVGD